MPTQSKFPIEEVELDETASKFLAAKKRSTALGYALGLKRFTYFYGHPLAEFIKEIEGEQEANKTRGLADRVRPGEQRMRDFIAWHEELGFAPKTTLLSVAGVQNFLKFYGINITFEFVELPRNQPLKENAKHEWTLDQIRQLVEALPYLRDKAIALCCFQSGLGIGDLLDLDYGDVSRELEAGKIPLAIEGYRKKTGVQLRTFIGRDAVHYLQLYLGSRTLKRDSPLFTLLGTEERMTGNAIRKQFREVAAKLDFILDEDLENGYNPGRTHSLRSAFRSRLTGKMDGDLIETFMAHDIGQEKATYMRLPLDELRELYANYEHLLAIEKTSKDELTAGAVPEAAMAMVRQQGQRLAEQDLELQQLRAQLEDLTSQVGLINAALSDPATKEILWSALEKIKAARAATG